MTLRDRIRIIIFEADTKAGRRFDVTLIGMILLSVLTVMLDSVPQINAKYGQQLYYAEWFFYCAFHRGIRGAPVVYRALVGLRPRASMGWWTY